MMGGMESRGSFRISFLSPKACLTNYCEEYTTTPPLPESSPAPLVESMQVSPLPHKAPFLHQVEITSPTPLGTPDLDDDQMMLDSPAPISRRPSLDLPKPSILEYDSPSSSAEDEIDEIFSRKIAAPRRPSLSRMKGYSTTALLHRPAVENPLPPFHFGGDTEFKPTSQLSLGECFNSASPPQDRRPTSASSQCAPIPLGLRSRPQFSSNNSSPRFPAPIQTHARRQSNTYLRNRKQMRRSLSMFEHPGDVMKPKPDAEEREPSRLQCVMDIEEAHEPVLPHFMADDITDTIPRITKETLLEVLDGKYAENFEQKMIIDCRFEYEYDGGHIDSAVNHNDKELLSNQLFNTPMNGRTLLVFHCEYSAHRAPLMARHIRSEDRTNNAEHYPRLTYPEVYILDGGYSGFFSEHRNRCFPPAYVEMSDEKHQRTCEREMGRLKSRKGLGRAQTFAFGQREPCVDDSPTAPGRPSSRNSPCTNAFGYSPLVGLRSPNRRMASY